MSKEKTPIPEILSTELVYRGYFDVTIDKLKSPGHPREIDYTKLNLKAHAAAVIARTSEGRFIVTREYRHPLRKWVLGCPGGRIDPGESPVEAAQRELLEESGYTAEKFSLLGGIYPLPAVTDQQIFYVLAENASYVRPTALEPLELIQTHLETEEELFAKLTSDTPIDGVFCTGLLLWKLLLLRG